MKCFLCLSVDSSLLNHVRVALIFEGLDTVAEVAIGSEVVGNSDNMFVRYIFDVKDQLQVRQMTYNQKPLCIREVGALCSKSKENLIFFSKWDDFMIRTTDCFSWMTGIILMIVTIIQ